MTDEIKDYYEAGLLIPTFQVKKNLFIWQHIANDVDFLNTQEKDVKALYIFTQRAAMTNFILNLGKLFDHQKKHPTRCIRSFLDLLTKDNYTPKQIEEDHATKDLLRDFSCPLDCISAVNDSDHSVFPKLFAKHFLNRLNDPKITKDVETIKTMRDKFIAHNEVIESKNLDLKVVSRLADFSAQILSIYAMAYHSTLWKNGEGSILKKNAESDAYFIKVNIDKLKNSA